MKTTRRGLIALGLAIIATGGTCSAQNPFTNGTFDPTNKNSVFNGGGSEHVDHRTPIVQRVAFRNLSARNTYQIAMVTFQGGTNFSDGTTGGSVDVWQVEGWYLVGPGQTINLYTGKSDRFYWFARAPHAVYSTPENRFLINPRDRFNERTDARDKPGFERVGFLEARPQRGGLLIELAGNDSAALTNGKPPPPAVKVGHVNFQNNYGAPIQLKLFHPANPQQPFTNGTVGGGVNHQLLLSGAPITIGSDWGIQIRFGNGVESPIRSVGSIADYDGRDFTVVATRVANGR